MVEAVKPNETHLRNGEHRHYQIDGYNELHQVYYCVHPCCPGYRYRACGPDGLEFPDKRIYDKYPCSAAHAHPESTCSDEGRLEACEEGVRAAEEALEKATQALLDEIVQVSRNAERERRERRG